MSNNVRTHRRNTLRLRVLTGAIALTTITACSGAGSSDPSSDASSAADPTTTTTTTTVDDAQQTALTCGAAGIEDGAQVRYRAETVIDAPLNVIWDLQTDVDQWPAWQQPVSGMESLTPGPLAEGSQFRWTTPAPATAITPATTLVITSTVENTETESCIRWSGPAIGDGLTIDNGVHVWNFSEVDGGVLVQTEESWTGAQVEADVPTSTMFLGAGLDGWLHDLKVTAEAQS